MEGYEKLSFNTNNIYVRWMYWLEKLFARCQFYIVQNKEGEHRLDGDYTIFGKAIKRMDIVDAIVNVKRDSTDQPLTPLTLDVNIISLTKQDLAELGYNPEK